MTMSSEADRNATSTAITANSTVLCAGDTAAIHISTPAMASWISTIQPRRRPRNGSSKRSISGAHRNLKV